MELVSLLSKPNPVHRLTMFQEWAKTTLGKLWRDKDIPFSWSCERNTSHSSFTMFGQSIVNVVTVGGIERSGGGAAVLYVGWSKACSPVNKHPHINHTVVPYLHM